MIFLDILDVYDLLDIEFFFPYLQTSDLSVLKVVFFVVWVLFSFLWFLSSIHSPWLELWMQEITVERTEELSSCSSCFLQEEVIWGRFVWGLWPLRFSPLRGFQWLFLLCCLLLRFRLSSWLCLAKSFPQQLIHIFKVIKFVGKYLYLIAPETSFFLEESVVTSFFLIYLSFSCSPFSL